MIDHEHKNEVCQRGIESYASEHDQRVFHHGWQTAENHFSATQQKLAALVELMAEMRDDLCVLSHDPDIADTIKRADAALAQQDQPAGESDD